MEDLKKGFLKNRVGWGFRGGGFDCEMVRFERCELNT